VRGGAEELLGSIVARADPARVEFTVACIAPGPFVDDLERAGARVVRMDAQRLRYPWAWARTVRALAALARDHDAVLSWQVKGNYYGTPAAKMAKKPSAWWDHGIRPARGEPGFVLEALLPRAPRADVVVTSSAAAAARHRGGRAILPGIDLSPYATPDRAHARSLLQIADEPAVGIVGRLQPWKGQHIFLRAAALVAESHPRALFFVIGGTPGGFSAGYPAHLQNLVRQLGIEERVWFMGQRPDVPSLLPGLDVFALASFDEPFGLVTVEAMAAGAPVVATRSGGTPEILLDGVTGQLVPNGDELQMARAIEAYLDDPARAGRIAAAARARAFDAFDVTRFVREVEDLAVELAGRDRSEKRA
jgi:glycosyltransferase involved in cell wall biosynthesis